jgi:cytochrome c-type biogenesis protein CcmH/NrfG
MALLCLNESGEALMRLGENDLALQSVSDALRLNPRDVTALRLRAEVIERMGGGN